MLLGPRLCIARSAGQNFECIQKGLSADLAVAYIWFAKWRGRDGETLHWEQIKIERTTINSAIDERTCVRCIYTRLRPL